MTPLLDVDRVRVLLAGNTVGMLTMSPSRTLAFAYDKTWLTHGFSISPISLPLRDGVFVAQRDPLNGMFGVFDDSMPDGWGRLLTDRMLRQHGIDPYSVGPLARLSIVGHGGMGALEYEPASTIDDDMQSFPDLDSLAEECLNVLSADCSNDLDQLFVLGGSSGGARPKILTAINGDFTPHRQSGLRLADAIDHAHDRRHQGMRTIVSTHVFQCVHRQSRRPRAELLLPA